MNHPIEVRGLTHAYGSREAIHDLTFDLPSGEILGLIGPNGAGKTTTLRILTGVMRPRAGEARVLGHDARRLDPALRARLGIVTEGVHLPGAATVAGLTSFCRALHPDWDEPFSRALQNDFGLDARTRVGALSRGQRAKLAFLLAVSHRPELLILDEPFGGLDALARSEILERLLIWVAETRCSVLVASHDLTEVERITDRVALLHSGRLVFCETVEALLARHRRVRMRLDADAAAAPPGELGLDVRRDGRMLEYVEVGSHNGAPAALPPGGERHPMTLEDIFLAWTRHLNQEARS